MSAIDAVIRDLLAKGVPMATIRAGISVAAARVAKDIAAADTSHAEEIPGETISPPNSNPLEVGEGSEASNVG